LKLYVASSWRNMYQPAIVESLRAARYDVYDFKNPRPGDKGFGWSSIDPDWQQWSPIKFRSALSHPTAVAGFDSDFDAMKWADAGVLVMSCGRSAHLEAGYFVGAGKPLFILLSNNKAEAELMYKMATAICVSLDELKTALLITETA
jgi:hypothetical protein